VRKCILAKWGAIASPALRKPAATLSPADIAEVERFIARQARRLREIARR
jgi:4-hydroxy-tetrahydrodipicolinate synthase